MKKILLALLSVVLTAGGPAAAEKDEEVIKVGIIGLDTSHVIAFTSILNDTKRKDHVPGAKVIAAYKGGSPDVTASATRVDKFTAEKDFGHEVDVSFLGMPLGSSEFDTQEFRIGFIWRY